MKRLAVIPARGGSKRIPNKNIKDFCGMPMIAHSIKIAQDSALFDTINISTDSKQIAETAAQYDCPPDFKRPADLADDHTSMMEALRYVVEEYEKRNVFFDTVALLYTTSPLTNPQDLNKACRFFEQGDKEKAILAVTPFPAPIEHAFRIQDNGDLVPDNEKALAIRTQDLKHAYYDAGMFAIYTPDYIKNSHKAGNFMAFKGFEVPSYRVTDIDWPEDWDRAEALYKTVTSMTSHAGDND